MTTTIFTGTGGSLEYVAHVVATDGRFLSVHVLTDDHRTVKRAARAAVKARGSQVRSIESVYLLTAATR